MNKYLIKAIPSNEVAESETIVKLFLFIDLIGRIIRT